MKNFIFNNGNETIYITHISILHVLDEKRFVVESLLLSKIKRKI